MARREQNNNAFRSAVTATSEIANAYRNGLKALKHGDSKKIIVADPRKIDGSVDIDNSVKSLYPKENRWDYAIGYNSQVCYVEVHPAYTSEVDTMLKKLSWLKNWLSTKAPSLNSIKKTTPAFVWIQSGKCAILSTSLQSKKLAQVGLPRPSLRLE